MATSCTVRAFSDMKEHYHCVHTFGKDKVVGARCRTNHGRPDLALKHRRKNEEFRTMLVRWGAVRCTGNCSDVGPWKEIPARRVIWLEKAPRPVDGGQ